MDKIINNIPKVFWYTLSLCMLLITLSFIYLSYKAQSVSVEIANTKVELLSTITDIKTLSKELEQKEESLKATTQPSYHFELPIPTDDISNKINNVEQNVKNIRVK